MLLVKLPVVIRGGEGGGGDGGGGPAASRDFVFLLYGLMSEEEGGFRCWFRLPEITWGQMGSLGVVHSAQSVSLTLRLWKKQQRSATAYNRL